MSEGMSDKMSEDMSEDMSDRMSEDMSDRMSVAGIYIIFTMICHGGDHSK
jgi:hypothetical protein